MILQPVLPELVVVALLVAGVGLGSVRIGPLDTIGVVLWRALGLDIGVTWTPATETIIWELRLPRVLTSMVIGAGLAVAGATFQGLLRNPLADPYILGVSAGAASGAGGSAAARAAATAAAGSTGCGSTAIGGSVPSGSRDRTSDPISPNNSSGIPFDLSPFRA